MLIDWFTFIAQLVNFLILVWLLNRFLYKPVLKALDEREKKIAAELQSAAAVQEEAGHKLSEWQQKNENFEKERIVMMQQAEKEAAEKKVHLLDEARKEYEALRARLQLTLSNEQKNLQAEIIKRISSEVFSIAEQILEELAGVSLEDRVVTVFCEHLRDTGKPDAAELAALINASHAPPVIRTAFNLSAEQRRRIQETVRELVSSELPITFETADSLFSGVELVMNGHSISWNLRDYLDSLKKRVEALHNGNPKTGENSNDSQHTENLP
jgi:F-type H+-transporting ATPase subunit b